MLDSYSYGLVEKNRSSEAVEYTVNRGVMGQRGILGHIFEMNINHLYKSIHANFFTQTGTYV